MSRMRIAVVVLAGSLGCYAPSFTDCELACGTGDSCPAGQRCVAGMCRDPGMSGSCSGGEIDAPIDGLPPPQWSVPEDVGIPLGFSGPTLLGNQREMYLAKNNELYVSLQSGTPPVWETPRVLPEFTAVGPTAAPYVTFDGNHMFVTRILGANGADIFVTERPTGIGAFGNIMAVTSLNGTLNDSGGSTTMDEQQLVFASNRAASGNLDLYASLFDKNNNVWRPPFALAGLSHPTANDSHPVVDGSGQRIVFASERSGNYNLYLASRTSDSDPFGPPAEITELSSNAPETDPWLAPDGRTIYFVRGTGPATRILRSVRLQ